MIDLVKQLHQQYGKFAFGLVAVIVLWSVMFRPLLAMTVEALQAAAATTRNAELATAGARHVTDVLVGVLRELQPHRVNPTATGGREE